MLASTQGIIVSRKVREPFEPCDSVKEASIESRICVYKPPPTSDSPLSATTTIICVPAQGALSDDIDVLTAPYLAAEAFLLSGPRYSRPPRHLNPVVDLFEGVKRYASDT